MIIDEQIKILESNSEFERKEGDLQGCLNFKQLAEWLKDYKRLKEQEPCEDAVSREAVMHILDEVGGDFDSPREAVVPIDYIADMVSDLPSVSPQPCDDCVSRQAVNELVDELARAISDERCCISRGRSTATIMRDILHLPPVTPQPKMGRWIKYGVPRCGEQHYKCTSCGYYINFGQWGELYTKEFKYCPSCGAKMQEVEND